MSIDELPYSEIASLFDRDPQEVENAGNFWLDSRKNRKRPVVPDIKLLAALSGLSMTSVSNFMRGRQGSVSAANANALAQLVDIVGYVPSSAAQYLRGRQSKTIGIALPLSSISPEFYLQILSGIKNEADLLGYRLLIFDVTTVTARDDFFLKMPFLGIVDGLIIIGLHVKEKRLQILEQRHLPLVAVHNRLDHAAVVANVLPASEDAFLRLIDQHLIKTHKVKQLALVTLGTANSLKMGDDGALDWTRNARIQAYLEALGKNDIPVNDKLIIQVKEHSFEEGYAAFEKIKHYNLTQDAEKKIDAVVCTSDTLAAGVITAAKRSEMEIAVTGFDNLPLAELLDITTIEQRAKDVGRSAFRHLYNALVYYQRTNQFPEPVEAGIGMQVVLRCSCGCPH